MHPAVDDVAKRPRELCGRKAVMRLQEPVERFSICFRNCSGNSQGYTEYCIRTQRAFVWRTVQRAQPRINRPKVVNDCPNERLGNFPVYKINGLTNAFAAVTLRITIPQFQSFVAARRSARWHTRNAGAAIIQLGRHLQSWVAARI